MKREKREEIEIKNGIKTQSFDYELRTIVLKISVEVKISEKKTEKVLQTNVSATPWPLQCKSDFCRIL